VALSVSPGKDRDEASNPCLGEPIERMLRHVPDLFVREIAVGIPELLHQSPQRVSDEGLLFGVQECLVHCGSSSRACSPRQAWEAPTDLYHPATCKDQIRYAVVPFGACSEMARVSSRGL
jgi:hypothetical protein